MNGSRLAWRCRRGMLELDLLLDGWLKNGWHDSTEQERAVFERLIEQPDQTLHDLFFGDQTVEDRTLADLIRKIRSAAAA